MPRSTLIVPTSETMALWRFFDSVSNAVAMRMERGSQPGEENLTFLLCELLDESATDLHKLDYSLAQLKSQLQNSDSGLSIDISFETHAHTSNFESQYSGADLGLVLTLEHPLLGSSKRAMLLQAKRLFPERKPAAFTLRSGYQSFDIRQAEFLNNLANIYQAQRSIFYLWYNPSSTAFAEADARHIRAYEAMPITTHSWRHHPFMDEMLEFGYPFVQPTHYSSLEITSSNEDAASKWRSKQPALRLSSLNTVMSALHDKSYPRLRSMYQACTEYREFAAFSPFADFMMLALLNSRVGSSSESWINLARGEKASPLNISQLKTQGNEKHSIEEIIHAPPPRHTLYISLRSTLPSIG